MKVVFLLIILAIEIIFSNCIQNGFSGVDGASVGPYGCYKEFGFDYQVIYINDNTAQLYPNTIALIEEARQNSFPLYLITHVNLSLSIDTQIQSYMSKIQIANFYQMYVSVMVEDVSWLDPDYNCYFLQSYYTKLKDYMPDRMIGFLSTTDNWDQITQGKCNKFEDRDVGYIYIDDQYNFDDWKDGQEFGGWDSPHLKKWKDSEVLCGVNISGEWARNDIIIE